MDLPTTVDAFSKITVNMMICLGVSITYSSSVLNLSPSEIFKLYILLIILRQYISSWNTVCLIFIRYKIKNIDSCVVNLIIAMVYRLGGE